jgi:hypothetical protein
MLSTTTLRRLPNDFSISRLALRPTTTIPSLRTEFLISDATHEPPLLRWDGECDLAGLPLASPIQY